MEATATLSTPPAQYPWRQVLEIRRDQIAGFTKIAETGDIVPFRMLRQQNHLATHPGAVKHVLVDNAENYGKQTVGYKRLRAVVGNGLLTSEGDFWRRQRRPAQP